MVAGKFFLSAARRRWFQTDSMHLAGHTSAEIVAH
jgi:hypothetical protein